MCLKVTSSRNFGSVRRSSSFISCDAPMLGEEYLRISACSKYLPPRWILPGRIFPELNYGLSSAMWTPSCKAFSCHTCILHNNISHCLIFQRSATCGLSLLSIHLESWCIMENSTFKARFNFEIPKWSSCLCMSVGIKFKHHELRSQPGAKEHENDGWILMRWSLIEIKEWMIMCVKNAQVISC